MTLADDLMKAKRGDVYAVNVLRGDGVRMNRGRFDSKEDAESFAKGLNSRVDADARDPKVITFKGITEASDKFRRRFI